MERCIFTAEETFVPYRKHKLFLHVRSHPTVVVESSSLAHTKLPKLTYNHHLPDQLWTQPGNPELNSPLSAVQLEAICYACQRHEELLTCGSRAGFFLGDSTGLGKGRTLAGIIYENSILGRSRAVWVTLSSDLFKDSLRDLHSLSTAEKAIDGIAWLPKGQKDEIPNFNDKTLLVTYSTLNSSRRRKQLCGSLGDGFDGVIILDECHRAKGKLSTAAGSLVYKLQKKLPLARFVYSSATAATSPQDIAYMLRLGIWGEGTGFKNVDHFTTEMNLRGLGAMEALAVQLKESGSFISRQLCMSSVVHDIVHVPVSQEFDTLYNECTQLWLDLMKMLDEKWVGVLARAKFWAAHQQFFGNLILASKVSTAVKIAKEAVVANKCVVFGIQKTGESRFKEVMRRGKVSECFSMARTIVEYIMEEFGIRPVAPLQVPSPAKKKKTNMFDDSSTESPKKMINENHNSSSSSPSSTNSSDSCCFEEEEDDIGMDVDVHDDDENSNEEMEKEENNEIGNLNFDELRKRIQSKYQELYFKFPRNPLDDLVDCLGGASAVAELTGRKFTQVASLDGYKSHQRKGHSSDKTVNLTEKDNFQKGIKKFAIISDASSTGISLHAENDGEVENGGEQLQRVHITLELPWSAEKVLQQLGRTHRTGQKFAPEHIFLASPIPGEDRFIYAIQERLSSMNAMTQGDRKASRDANFSSKLLTSSIGRAGLEDLYKCLLGFRCFNFPIKWTQEELDSAKNFISSLKLTKFRSKKETNDKGVRLFLNRILGAPIPTQRILLDLFYGSIARKFKESLANIEFDCGIMSATFPEHSNVTQQFVKEFPVGNSRILVSYLQADFRLDSTGMKRILISRPTVKPRYLYRKVGQLPEVLLVYKEEGSYFAYSPIDVEKFPVTADFLSQFYVVQKLVDFILLWEEQYGEMDSSCSFCMHHYKGLDCRVKDCIKGNPSKEITIVGGCVNAVWGLIKKFSGRSSPSIVRIQLSNGKMIIGVSINDRPGEDSFFSRVERKHY